MRFWLVCSDKGLFLSCGTFYSFVYRPKRIGLFSARTGFFTSAIAYKGTPIDGFLQCLTFHWRIDLLLLIYYVYETDIHKLRL